MLERNIDSSSKTNNDSSSYDSGFDDDSSEANSDFSSYDSDFDDSNSNINSYQFEVNCNDINESHEYSCDPMLYHILNYPDFYTYDPNIALNEEYFSKTYDDSEMLNINLFKQNIISFISNFHIENYELNNEKNDVINISKYNTFYQMKKKNGFVINVL